LPKQTRRTTARRDAPGLAVRKLYNLAHAGMDARVIMSSP